MMVTIDVLWSRTEAMIDDLHELRKAEPEGTPRHEALARAVGDLERVAAALATLFDEDRAGAPSGDDFAAERKRKAAVPDAEFSAEDEEGEAGAD